MAARNGVSSNQINHFKHRAAGPSACLVSMSSCSATSSLSTATAAHNCFYPGPWPGVPPLLQQVDVVLKMIPKMKVNGNEEGMSSEHISSNPRPTLCCASPSTQTNACMHARYYFVTDVVVLYLR